MWVRHVRNRKYDMFVERDIYLLHTIKSYIRSLKSFLHFNFDEDKMKTTLKYI